MAPPRRAAAAAAGRSRPLMLLMLLAPLALAACDNRGATGAPVDRRPAAAPDLEAPLPPRDRARPLRLALVPGEGPYAPPRHGPHGIMSPMRLSFALPRWIELPLSWIAFVLLTLFFLAVALALMALLEGSVQAGFGSREPPAWAMALGVLVIATGIALAGFLAWRLTARFRRPAAWSVLGLAGLVVVAAITVHAAGAWVLRRELADWRRLGGTIDLAELAPPPLAPDDNAATLYAQAFAAFPRVAPDPTGSINVSPRGPEDVLTADLDELEAFVREYGAALELAIEASKRPACVWPVDHQDGPWMLLPHLGDCRRLTHALIARARLRAVAGDWDGAAADLEAALHLASHAGEDGTIIGALVAVAINARVTQALEALFEDAPAAPPRLERALAEGDVRPLFRRALLTEGATMCYLGLHHPGVKGEFRMWRATGLARFDAATYLDRMGQLVEACDRPWWELETTAALPPPPAWALLVTRLGDTSAGVLWSGRAAQAELTLSATALRLRRHQVEHGAYPSTLDALGEVPLDPWDSQPLRYERRGEGFALWSAGDGWQREPTSTLRR